MCQTQLPHFANNLFARFKASEAPCVNSAVTFLLCHVFSPTLDYLFNTRSFPNAFARYEDLALHFMIAQCFASDASSQSSWCTGISY
jgi:hypothetical protein